MHVFVFTPNSNDFIASEKLCHCDDCRCLDFHLCSTFRVFSPQVARLNEMATRSKSLVEDEERELTSDIGDLVTKGSLFAVRAENAFNNCFLLRCDQEATIHEQKEPLKQSDGSGNVIYFGEKYLTGQYLSNFVILMKNGMSMTSPVEQY